MGHALGLNELVLKNLLSVSYLLRPKQIRNHDDVGKSETAVC